MNEAKRGENALFILMKNAIKSQFSSLSNAAYDYDDVLFLKFKTKQKQNYLIKLSSST
jgi:hypothetical protein